MFARTTLFNVPEQKKFFKKDMALWVHPLGLFYRVRVASSGHNSDFGDFAIISVKNSLLVCVPQSSLRHV